MDLAFSFQEAIRIGQLGTADQSEFDARLAHEQGADEVLVPGPVSIPCHER
jgi:hypothetical protein